MSGKLRNILSIVFLAIPSLMVLVSAGFKLSGHPLVVEKMTRIGYGSYLTILGAAEVVFLILLWVPKTWRVGFFFLLSYLGGASAIEISVGETPNALGLIMCLWIGAFLKEERLFTGSSNA